MIIAYTKCILPLVFLEDFVAIFLTSNSILKLHRAIVCEVLTFKISVNTHDRYANDFCGT